MSTWMRKAWPDRWGKIEKTKTVEGTTFQSHPRRGGTIDVDLQPGDPLLDMLLKASGPLKVDELELDSPVLQELKRSNVKLIQPLISQGELIGMLNLGARLSEQEYSSDDFHLLGNLATQAAPALRVAQLAQQQKVEARELERLEQELRVARIIQETLLPKELPTLAGWTLRAHWQPAREVSGDFYDFLAFEDGRLGFFVSDVTGKGVPAALVMATTRSLLRGAAEHGVSPGKVLERVNEELCPDIPEKMFVTCLYAILEPRSGQMVYANAGHMFPIHCSTAGVVDLRASGMPLGLLPGAAYEEKEATISMGGFVLLYSDGIVEAHNDRRELYGFSRLKEKLAGHQGDGSLIPFLLDDLEAFTGKDREQEDDITLVILTRSS